MELILQYITFTPWILYFIEIMYYRSAVIERHELEKKSYFEYINKNFFKSINMKELALFCIFILFMQRENTMVLEILFPTIYLFLLIDFFHTLAYDCKKIKYKSLMVQSVIIVVGVILYFFLTKHLYTTYNLMFIVSILSAFLMYGFSIITTCFSKKSH